MFPALEGLRAFGALSVATAHSWPSLVRDLAWFNGSFAVVEMFFVMSGFLVTRAYAHRVHGLQDVAGFATKRLGRLYPLHLAVLLAWVAIFYAKQGLNLGLTMAGIDLGMTPVADQAPFEGVVFLLHLTMLQGLGFTDSLAFNFPAWSISAEFAAFLLVMAVFALTSSGASRIKVALLGLGLCTAHYVWAWLFTDSAPAINEPLIARGITRSGAAYFIGVLGFEWQRRYRLSASAWQQGVIQALCLTCLLVLIPNQASIALAQLWASGLWAVLIVSLCSGEGWLVRLFSRPSIVWLGQRSYALYLTHALLLLLVQRRVARLDDDVLLNIAYVAYLVACVGLAALAHRYIERPGYEPFRRWAARMAGNRPSSHATGQPAGQSHARLSRETAPLR
ncbi:MAG: acyltransferase family protein [Burkholderiaceae bacterium]